jgi:DNA-binding NtrC family response regulator
MHALLVYEEQDVLEHIRWMLMREDCGVSAFSSMRDAISGLRQGLRPDIALIHAGLRVSDGTPALTSFRQASPAIPAIAISCCHDPRCIVETIRTGAVDVLIHPFDRAELKTTLKRCLDFRFSRKQPQVREIPLGPNTSFVFSSEQMAAIASQCELVARTDLPVLILGESGTGKEILAQYIHKVSSCSSFPFLKVNCAAMPTDLLESELFGYEQGAFTGALKPKPGKFELCDRGTIFLDEIGEMPPALQAKLLQVLQDGTFSRLGGRTTIKVEVRVIAATNIDIKSAITERHFREDLYYRINGFSFHLPPLRKRREEIPVLIRYFIQRAAEKYARRPGNMSPELLAACMQHDWPGNLRELENFVKRYLVLGDNLVMMAELSHNPAPAMVPELDPGLCTPTGGLKKLLSNVKGEAEAKVIRAVLQRNDWRRKKTAAELKISYKALLYKMRQHDIVAPQAEVA